VRRDEAANLYVRFGPDGPCVLVGSHLDSVPEGGRYDGALGVVCAVEAVEAMLDAGVEQRRAVEVVAWADEEGARFGVGLFGSAAAYGRLPPGASERRDRAGISVADALRRLGSSGEPARARRPDGSTAAYLELHIEQGPRLEGRGLALGVVSDIVGIFHGRLTVRGRADHAGATAMGARRDALAATAELVLAVERSASAVSDAVGTVGEIAVSPGAKNVVPGACTVSLDLRAPRDDALTTVLAAIEEAARAIEASRGVSTSLDVLARVPATALDPRIRDVLVRSAAAIGVKAPLLVSGAGHDAQNPQLAGVPSGMLFVRSSGGSHTPTEFASVEDATLGAQALALAIAELAG
jgi:allantoate deiminase